MADRPSGSVRELGPNQDPATDAILVQDTSILRPDFFEATKAGKDRQRLALACSVCRRKKVKCDGRLPKCDRCQTLGLECGYKLTTHRKTKKGPVSASNPRSSIETPASHNHAYSSQNRDGSREPQFPHGGRVSLTADHLMTEATVTVPNGLHHPVEQLAPEDSNHNNRILRYDPSTWPPGLIMNDDGQLIDITKRRDLQAPLPPHKLLIDLCQIYFTKIYAQVYAFLHPPSFMQAVVEDPDELNPTLLLAICALSARFHKAAPPGSLTPDVWASACLNMIFSPAGLHNLNHTLGEHAYNGNSYFRHPSVSAVQALSVLSYHYFGQGQSSVAWVMSGFAVRMAHALHLNDEFHGDPIGRKSTSEITLSFRDREVRRRTFWATFMMDRLNSAGENRPFTIRSDEINIQLPIRQEDFNDDVPGITQSLDGSIAGVSGELAPQNTAEHMDCMAYLIRIVDLWGEVTCFVQNPGPGAQWEPNSNMLCLRSRILFWAESLPFALRHGVHKTNQSPTWYIMHAAYYLSLCVMHRFALPRGVQQYAVDHIPPPFLNICVKEAIHNAQRVSEIIQSLPPGLRITAPFMGYAAFSAATMHAFLGYHVSDMNPEHVQRSREYVHSSLAFLKELGRAWTPVSKMYEALASQAQVRKGHKERPRASILHDSGSTGVPSQFGIPDSVPSQFSNQQQIDMNTLLFSNWFNNGATQNYFDPSWTTPGVNVPCSPVSAAGPAPVINAASRPLTKCPDAGLSRASSSSQVRERPRGEEAPYGAIPATKEGDGDEVVDDEAADLLVFFQSSDKTRVPSHDGSRGATAPPESRTHMSRKRMRQELDFVGNLKEKSHSAAVDVLQLMKVGVITSENWS